MNASTILEWDAGFPDRTLTERRCRPQSCFLEGQIALAFDDVHRCFGLLPAENSYTFPKTVLLKFFRANLDRVRQEETLQALKICVKRLIADVKWWSYLPRWAEGNQQRALNQEVLDCLTPPRRTLFSVDQPGLRSALCDELDKMAKWAR